MPARDKTQTTVTVVSKLKIDGVDFGPQLGAVGFGAVAAAASVALGGNGD